MPYDDVISFTPNGIPFMAPEVALLFKAKHNRSRISPTSTHRPLLSKGQTEWLREGLLKLHPGHPWIPALRSQ